MQKSRNATIFLIVGILCFGLLGGIYLIKSYNLTYLYFINPLVWILFAVSLHFLLGKNMENKKLRKQIIHYTLIAAVTFIITYMISGLVVTFGRNPYDTTLRGFLYNFWSIGIILIAKEYVRYKLINNVYDKHKKEIAILIGVVYVLIDFEYTKFIGVSFSALWLARYIVQYMAPSIAKNIVFSFTAIYSDYLPGIIYQLLTNLYVWLSPILPNAPWVMTSIIEITIPIILFLYIRYIKNKLNIYKSKEDLINSDPRNIIPLVVMIILAIWFAIGIFPIKPVAIATGSMEKEIMVGDVAIIKKCKANDVNVGDIIEYSMGDFTVIHRIIEKTQKNGSYFFVTKGDNNNTSDKEEVREDQLIGKVVFKIRYIGYPAVWLHIEKQQEALDSI